MSGTKKLTIEQVLTLLPQTPLRLAELTAGLAPAELQATPTPGEWSANQVLAHLRACADVWGNCMAVILAEDTPTLRAINPKTWIKGTNYPQQQFQSSLQTFAAQRTALLAVLSPLPPAGWLRAATVTGAGKPLVRTVQFYAQWLTRHERSHFKQIERIVKILHE